ncbi:hypothetical protein GCM10010869_47880 [Mesorhizobium tianshanense]|uniref:Uncharacterized protein n=1 Tax=Mesorhizobium tianshanense TaxID=39844 RepID=A0A562NUB9_9HYPH|nr:hypothetical protein [Mesorhizobium tianshanense]TWI35286.1 hypothetical protein IQ26_03266 [Mesorhizobium tianshanense]GLS39191.1 hypothetical protein GCM10010869_47880 [Mesorhizobium tianshanense]
MAGGVESIYFTVTVSDKSLRITDKLPFPEPPPTEFSLKVGDAKREVAVTTLGNNVGSVDVHVSKDEKDWFAHEENMEVEAGSTYNINDKAFPPPPPPPSKSKQEAAKEDTKN